jgi:hypothetical protein
MRKELLALGIAMLACTAVMAQDAPPPPPSPGLYTNTGGIYIKGGLNLANVSTSSDGSVNSAHTRASFNAGFVGDVPLTNFLSLQLGAVFTGKGSKAQYNSTLYSGTYNFVYGAVGVAGNYEADATSGAGSSTSTQAIKWTNSGDITTGPENGSGAGVLRRYDFGMNYLAGLELGPVQITANYGMGLTKISSNADNNNDDDKNRVFSINLGFRL